MNAHAHQWDTRGHCTIEGCASRRCKGKPGCLSARESGARCAACVAGYPAAKAARVERLLGQLDGLLEAAWCAPLDRPLLAVITRRRRPRRVFEFPRRLVEVTR